MPAASSGDVPGSDPTPVAAVMFQARRDREQLGQWRPLALLGDLQPRSLVSLIVAARTIVPAPMT